MVMATAFRTDRRFRDSTARNVRLADAAKAFLSEESEFAAMLVSLFIDLLLRKLFPAIQALFLSPGENGVLIVFLTKIVIPISLRLEKRAEQLANLITDVRNELTACAPARKAQRGVRPLRMPMAHFIGYPQDFK
jgi:hypothetical protein